MKKLTPEQGAVVGAFTGVLAGQFSDMHRYLEKILDRPVWTHELAADSVTEEIKAASKADFLAIVATDKMPEPNRQWVCIDWYFDVEQYHVRAWPSKPGECFWKRDSPTKKEHTARCGWYDVTITPMEET